MQSLRSASVPSHVLRPVNGGRKVPCPHGSRAASQTREAVAG